MSDLIKLLPENIANQIAAGEVIQRPASVVKELLENAIDAGAERVDVNIKDSGKTLIQVVDNGAGMSSSDALMCFKRHATSKVKKADDLFALTTKGFRGEALASISAIAHVELKTKTAENEIGFSLIIEGGKIKEQEEMVTPVGSSFEVKNLFFNVPARRNFLKKESTEFRHIQDEFERVVLAHPEIHFTLKHNDSELYNLPASVLRKRIVDVLGNNSNNKLVPIEESTDIVSLHGFVLKPEHARKTRGEQFMFVNNRFFKSHYFNHSITKAFQGLIKEGTFPGYFLYMNVNPEKIDVNVHPTKTEIKFEEEKFIYSILLSSIRQALGKYNIAPTLEFDRESSFDIPHSMRSQEAVEPTIKVNSDFNPFKRSSLSSSNSKGKSTDNFSKAITNQGFGQDKGSSDDWADFYQIEEDSDKLLKGETELIHEEDTQDSIYIRKGNYIITPSKSGLLVINYKRAIEQIVYSSLSKTFISKPVESQSLLFPIEKEISKRELILWQENQKLLEQLGFKGSINEQVLSVSAVPSVLQEETISSSIDDIFTTIGFKDLEKGDIAHNMIASVAQSASQKNVSLNTKESIQALINQLFQCENHMFTPRKKKILETISLDELKIKFQ